jgi:hypothetical protein
MDLSALPVRQFVASIILSIFLLLLIIRLVQKGRLDIAYCWVWLGVGAAALLVVARYDLLTKLSEIIGAVANTTTLFLISFLILLLMCLQFSLVISHHRRQIKRLTQQLALVRPISDEKERQQSGEWQAQSRTADKTMPTDSMT